jgi:hypothetical protein
MTEFPWLCILHEPAKRFKNEESLKRHVRKFHKRQVIE